MLYKIVLNFLQLTIFMTLKCTPDLFINVLSFVLFCIIFVLFCIMCLRFNIFHLALFSNIENINTMIIM